MKLLLPLVASVALSVNLFSQGQINFANAGPGVNSPCYCGAELAAPTNGPWLAMLYAGPAGTPEDLLSSAIVSGVPVAIGGSVPGYFFGGTRTITGVPAFSQAVLQVRAWRSDFPTWEAAVAATGSFGSGKSNPLTIRLGGGADPSVNLVGLNPIVMCIPEPSVTIMGMLGLVVVTFRIACHDGRSLRH